MQFPSNHLHDIRRTFVETLSPIYPAGEIDSILRETINSIDKYGYSTRWANADFRFNQTELIKLNQMLERLKIGEPLQYITGFSWFDGMKFKVDAAVLIPRPETEELLNLFKSKVSKRATTLIDLCTGSGCIAIALKKAKPSSKVIATDWSEKALIVAKENAKMLNQSVEFMQFDLLNENEWPQYFEIDGIISNPPYVLESEKNSLHPNVLNFEPSLALFAPANDALAFYKAIARFGSVYLKPEGCIACEMNPMHANEIKFCFDHSGFASSIHVDLQNKKRFILATKI